jgi:zinc protease
LRAVLDNGLTVLLRENHAAKVAAMQLWVKVGSADELEDEAGLAHLHEHMLFKGTSKRGPGEIARTVETCGGDINAWTSYDQTVYHLVLASEFFGEGLDILSDAVTNSLFDPTELSREIEVVCEEIRRSDDSPSRRMSRLLFSSAYEHHPYRKPVIGSEQSVRSFTREKILDFYHRHYSTPQMVFVAVGDFNEQEAFEQVKKAFAGARTKATPKAFTRLPEAPQKEPRVAISTAPVNEAHLQLAWHIPSVKGEDIAALDLLAALLGQGDASRLTLEVKRERSLVNEIHASAYTPQDPGLMIIGATLKPEQIREALPEILRQTYRLRREEFTADDLDRAKRIVESEAIYGRETVQGLARRLGFFETVLGGAEEEEKYLQAVATTTLKDLREAADTYLRTENLTAAVLLPENATSAIDADSLQKIVSEAEAQLSSQVTTRETRPYRRLLRTSEAGGTTAVSTQTLSSGLKLIVKQDRTAPLVSVRASWLGGLRWELPENNGINVLLGRSLLRGTKSRNGRELARQIDEIAAAIHGAAGKNSFGARGEFLAAEVERGFELFGDVVFNSAFDAEEVEKEKALILQDIRTRDDSPAGVAFSLFQEALYDHHPYRMEQIGTEASIGALSSDALHRYRRDNYRLDNLTLAVVGDITPERARELVEKHVAGGDRGASASPSIQVEGPLSAPREVQKKLERRQAHLVIGFRGTTIESPDRFPLAVMSSVLSGQGGRLFIELRDKRSMAYSVTSMVSEGIDPGFVAVYIGTSPEKVGEARQGMRAELDRIRSEPISAAELDRARRHLIGSHEIGLQRIAARAAVLALDETYGLGVENHLRYAERIRSVTAEDVLRVAQRYIDFERSVTALVSPSV